MVSKFKFRPSGCGETAGDAALCAFRHHWEERAAAEAALTIGATMIMLGTRARVLFLHIRILLDFVI